MAKRCYLVTGGAGFQSWANGPPFEWTKMKVDRFQEAEVVCSMVGGGAPRLPQLGDKVVRVHFSSGGIAAGLTQDAHFRLQVVDSCISASK